MKVDRNKWREGLKQRQEQEYEKRIAGEYKTIWKETPPRPYWKLTDGVHMLNIIPFFAGKQHPRVMAKELLLGKPTYILPIFVHRNIGPRKDSYVCMTRTYAEKCPICEHRDKLRMQGETSNEVFGRLTASKRAIYLIECLDTTEQKQKELQIFETSYKYFEEEVSELAKLGSEGGFEYYTEIDDKLGKIVSFKVTNAGKREIDFKAFRLLPRKEEISDKLLSQTFVIDEYLHLPTYEEVYKAFFQEDVDDSVHTEEAEKEEEEKDVPDLGPVEEEKEEEVIEEEPEQRKSPKQTIRGLKCRHGEFGKDNGFLPECEDCSLWDACAKKANELATSVEKEPIEEKPKVEPPKPMTTRRRPGR